MKLDVFTLTVAALATWVLATGLMLFKWRTGKTYPGFGHFVASISSVTIGSLLILFQGIKPLMSVGSGLVNLGALYALFGARRFLQIERSTIPYWLGLVLTHILHTISLFIYPDVNMRILVMSAFVSASCLLAGLELIRRRPSYLRTSCTFTACALFINGLSFAFRASVVILQPVQTYFDAGVVQNVGFMASLVTAMLSSWGYVMMNSQRLEHDLEVASDELRTSLNDLQQRTGEIKVLSGLLPICASCKKVRDDQGYWQQIEGYIHDHSEAQFSHGLESVMHFGSSRSRTDEPSG
jgi:hypothetical protein